MFAEGNETPGGEHPDRRSAGGSEGDLLAERRARRASETEDPALIRRRNLIPPEDFPHETATGASYDSGAYEEALDVALQLAGYDQLRAEQRRRREAGDRRQLGVGLSCYVEITALASPTEYASVEARTEGGILVLAGTASHGQGHETTYAQIAAEGLGTSPEAIQVVQGDTGRVPRGDGTSSSRSVQLAGSAILRIGYERWLRNIAVAMGNALRKLQGETPSVELRAALDAFSS